MNKKTLHMLLVMVLITGLIAGAALDAGAKKKKKKKKKKPKVKTCAPYVPGELGAEAETIKITDANTAEAPLEATLTLDPGVGQATGLPTDAATTAAQSHAYVNVQVDPKAKEAGLFMFLPSPVPDDNDLYLLHSTGTEAAHAAGFTGAHALLNSNQYGGHTDADGEWLDGIRSADCYGYTVHAIGANSRGGEITMKFWLGEASDYEVPAP
jgi:hypothetical protein